MKQKFGKLRFVNIVTTNAIQDLINDGAGLAIVEGTYSQLYGGDNIKSYALWIVKDGKVVNRVSWYREEALALAKEQDRDKAEEMIEEYNLRRAVR
jgi:hypothetical protein